MILNSRTSTHNQLRYISNASTLHDGGHNTDQSVLWGMLRGMLSHLFTTSTEECRAFTGQRLNLPLPEVVHRLSYLFDVIGVQQALYACIRSTG